MTTDVILKMFKRKYRTQYGNNSSRRGVPSFLRVIRGSVADGTRITTGYTIEKEPVTCDWTEEEVLLYFVSDEQHRVMDEALTSSSRTSAYHEEKINELLIRDSFVSVLLTCRAEHKNYAAVSYDQSAVNCTLSMPDDLRVSISRRGHYEVSMADGVNLKVIKTW